MEIPVLFPTISHQEAATALTDFFSAHPAVEAVLLVNSCARGKAIPQSDLDMAVLSRQDFTPADILSLEEEGRRFVKENPAFKAFVSGPFTRVHLDCFNGSFHPTVWDDGGGPDDFELEIGNRVAYSVPLWERGNFFREVKTNWLPYYNHELQAERLVMVRNACLYDIEQVSIYTGRGLYFQAFDRLYKAFREFLQALFIAHNRYPLAYNKWVHEQVVEWLKLPELYAQLPQVLEISGLESNEVIEKGKYLGTLVEQWIHK